MPINLDDLSSASLTMVKPPVRAVYFHSALTGTPGASTGRLNVVPASALSLDVPDYDKKARLPISVYTADSKYRIVPLIPESVASDRSVLGPAGSEMLVGSTSMVPCRAVIKTSTDIVTNKTTTQIGIIWATNARQPNQSGSLSVGSFDELEPYLSDNVVEHMKTKARDGGYDIASVLAHWAEDLSDAADDQTKVSLLERHVCNLFNQNSQNTELCLSVLEALDRAGTTTNAWSRVYRHMLSVNMSDEDRQQLLSGSTRLGLTGTLDNLHQAISAGVLTINPVAGADPQVLRAELLTEGLQVSDQQWAAVSQPGPLTMVIAGAGSGKTSTMAARIAALVKCGVLPEQVAVMSFTNAAVDAMVARSHTSVRTTTFAAMLIGVVRNHLSRINIVEPAQLLNALAIHRLKIPADLEPVYLTLCDAIRETNKFSVDPARIEDLRSLILSHPTEIIAILGIVELVTLDMVAPLVEHIIAVDPTALASAFAGVKYLMVDEAQDTSTTELDVTLRAALAAQMNLFIIGDPSQNLYQFRGASPDALVSLASSKTATTVDLTTNYRSNQDILDLGNALLEQASATNVTGISLMSNNLEVSDPKTFADNVDLIDADTTWYRVSRKPVEAINGLGVEAKVGRWLARDWTVGVLTPAGRVSAALVEHIAGTLGVKAANLTSARGKAFTGLSSVLVSSIWQQVAASGDPHKWALSFSALAGVLDPRNSPSLTGSAVTHSLTTDPTTIQAAQNWWLANKPLLMTMIQALPGESDPTYPARRAQALEVFINTVIQFESAINRRRSANLSRMNGERKKVDDSPLSAGTIHSAKGLEFDATVVVVDTDRLTSQEAIRLYYVALTRARHQTMVVVVGSDQRIRLAWERTLASRVRSEVLAAHPHPVEEDFQRAAEKYAKLFERVA
jgi:DNA helicase-2/ATP-dependent DNA helicase PcrA